MKRDKNAGAKRATNKAKQNAAYERFASLTQRLLKVRTEDLPPPPPKKQS